MPGQSKITKSISYRLPIQYTDFLEGIVGGPTPKLNEVLKNINIHWLDAVINSKPVDFLGNKENLRSLSLGPVPINNTSEPNNSNLAEQLNKSVEVLKSQLESEKSKSSELNAQLKSESQKCIETGERLNKSVKEIGFYKTQIIDLTQNQKESEANHQKSCIELKRRNENLETENRELKKQNLVFKTEIDDEKSIQPTNKPTRMSFEILHPSIKWDKIFS